MGLSCCAMGTAILASTVAARAGTPPTLCLEHCADGCALTPGVDDSRLNRSSLISGTRNLAGFAYGDDSWIAVVDCVRDTFSPYAIAVSDVDPVAGEHIEVMVAGTPQQIGSAMGAGAVSPVTCEGDRVVESGIGFAFANIFGDVPLEICWSASQAAGSLLGLDHELLAGDVMTYLSGPPPKRFLDEEASCGEFAPRGRRAHPEARRSSGASSQSISSSVRPVIPDEVSLARKTTASATSVGRTKRPSGDCSIRRRSRAPSGESR